MNTKTRMLVILCLMAIAATSTRAEGSLASVCEYDPPESRVVDLTLQGTFQWYDGPSAQPDDRALSGTFLAEFNTLRSTAAFARQVEARGEVRGGSTTWNATFVGMGSLTSYLRDDIFGVAGIGVAADVSHGAEIDLSGGIGTGRFRDVSPMARAIRMQNALLDIGQLLAPLNSDALGQVAQILGEIGPTNDEKLTQAADLLQQTGLLPERDLSIRGWLAMESALISAEPSRLCGSDVQVRVGATASIAKGFTVSATGILLARYAAVPDPVSQWAGDVEARFRIAAPQQLSIRGDASYARRLPDGWSMRTAYRLEVDHLWRDPTDSWVRHEISSRLTSSVLGGVGLSLVCDLHHQTGDEQVTVSLALRIEADLL